MSRAPKFDPVKDAHVTEHGWRESFAGNVLRIHIEHVDSRPMSWPEVQAVFADRYPGHWALSIHPPAEHVIDEANYYHLWVLPEGVKPWGACFDSSNRTPEFPELQP